MPDVKCAFLTLDCSTLLIVKYGFSKILLNVSLLTLLFGLQINPIKAGLLPICVTELIIQRFVTPVRDFVPIRLALLIPDIELIA